MRIPPVLRDVHFRRYWIGQSVSLIGDQVALLALPLVGVLVLHAGPAQMGVLVAVGWLPSLLFSLAAGAWLDRRGRRRQAMIGADIARTLLLVTLPVAAWLGVLTLVQLYVIAFCVGTFDVIFNVASTSVFATMVPRAQYVSASSLLNGSRAVADMGGQSLAGALVALLTAPTALLVDAMSFVVSAAMLVRIHPSEAPASTAGSQVLRGARWIVRSSLVRRMLLTTATLNLFNFVYYGVFVLYAVTVLGIGPATLGVVLGIGALGAVVGSLLATPVSRRVGLGATYAFSCVVFAAPLLLVPLAPVHSTWSLVFVGVAEFVSGFGVLLFDIASAALQAAAIPTELRASVAGAYRTVNYGVRPLGAVAGGLIGAVASTHVTLWIGAAGAPLCVLWLIGSGITSQREVDAQPV